MAPAVSPPPGPPPPPSFPPPSEQGEDGLDARVHEFVLVDVDDDELPIANDRRESLAPHLAHPPPGAVACHPDRVRRLAVAVRDEPDDPAPAAAVVPPTPRRGIPPRLHDERVVHGHAVHRLDAGGLKIGDAIDVSGKVTLAARGGEGAGDAEQDR